MATKPDFAQKLLNDLRLRKERMAAGQSSSSSRHPIPVSAEVHGNSRQIFKGSRETRTLETMVNKYKGGNVSQRILISAEASSQQMVPYGKSHSTLPMGELSLQQLVYVYSNRRSSGRTSTNIDMQSPSRTQFPTLTNLHINEIAKGAQNLNQILQACSINGLHMDRGSVEIGKQLLKGALDLEESLRMLVSLQEASDYMITPKRRTQIKLLDDGEDGDDDSPVDIAVQKHVDRPVFSFDKPKHEKWGSMNLGNSSHRHSASCVEDWEISSVMSKSSGFKQGMASIPNVIAKLMGLEELPPDANRKNRTGKQAASDHKLQGMASARGRSKSTELKNQADEKGLRSNQIAIFTSNPQNELYLLACSDSYRPMTDSREERLYEVEREEAMHSTKESKLSRVETCQIQSEITQVSLKGESRKGRREEPKADHIQEKVPKSKKNGTTKEPVIKDELQRVMPVAKASSNVQKTASKPRVIKVNQQNKAKEIKLNKQKEENQQKENNKKPPVPKTRGSELFENKNSTKVMQYIKGSQTSRQPTKQEKSGKKNSATDNAKTVIGDLVTNTRHDDVRDENSVSSDTKMEVSMRLISVQNASSGGEENKPPLENFANPSKVEVKFADTSSVKKVLSARKVLAGGVALRTDEAMTRRAKGKMKQGASIFNEVTHRELKKISSSRGAQLTNNCKADEESKEMIGAEQTEKLTSAIEYDNEAKAQPPVPSKGQELMPHETEIQPSGLVSDDSTDISLAAHQKQHRPAKLDSVQQPLKDGEIDLKKVLITSDLFLNTAEALFKLNIPVGILNASEQHICEEEGSKLILDCCYNILKRKGRRQELCHYPCVLILTDNVSVIRSLDDLVKQLHKDLEILRSYGRNGRYAEYDDANYLLQMVERDVHHRDPDVNSMWDLGWNGIVFAYVERDDVVRDVEKVLLDEFMSEIAKDFVEIGSTR
ncbi:hypothetical protein Ancab_016265 [Ancistrocladus abbreviatus]